MSIPGTPANYWLLKSEPDEFGIEDLKKARKQTTAWTGVRNFQARNFIRDGMAVGDQGFFYHSSCAVPGIVGIVEIVRAAYVDPTQFDPQSDYYDAKSKPEKPQWVAVDVKFVEQLATPLSLDFMKTQPALAGMRVLMRGNRLSITPVAPEHWRAVLKLAKGAARSR